MSKLIRVPQGGDMASGGSLEFNGGFIDISPITVAPQILYSYRNASFLVSFWIKLLQGITLPLNRAIISCVDPSSNSPNRGIYNIYVGTNRSIGVMMEEQFINTTSPLLTEQWYHYAIWAQAINGGNYSSRAYLNGIINSSTSSTYIRNISSANGRFPLWYIGNAGQQQGFFTYLNNTRITQMVISGFTRNISSSTIDAIVASLYNNGTPPNLSTIANIDSYALMNKLYSLEQAEKVVSLNIFDSIGFSNGVLRVNNSIVLSPDFP